MRPIYLKMEAIGPFYNKCDIDFTFFDKNSLFLIHGPTGQGKSFIFDAITYALYAETPSERHSHLKSDWAADDKQAYIEFIFTIGEEKYLIRRTLGYNRPSKRGDKTVWVEAQQELYQFTETENSNELGPLFGNESTEKKLIAKKRSEVKNKVIDLIGMERGQFQQVIFLPQGEFRKLLLSTTQEREILLEKLFDVSFYQALQKELEEDVRKNNKEKAILTTKLEQIEKHIQNFIPEDLYEIEEDQIISRFETEISKMITESEKLKETTNQLKYKIDKIELFDSTNIKLNNIKKEEEEHLQNKKEIEQKITLRDRAREATSISHIDKNLLKIQKENIYLIKSLEDAIQIKNELTNKKKELENNSVFIDKEKEKQKDTINEISSLKPIIEQLLKKEKQLEKIKQIEAKIYEAQNQITETKKKLSDNNESLKEIKKEISKLNDSDSNIEKEQLKLSILNEKSDSVIHYEKIVNEEKILINKEEIEKNEVKRDNLELKELLAQREQNLAAELSILLEDKKPCPVCGSLDHPKPAEKNENAPSKEKIIQFEKGLEIKKNKHRTLEAKLISIKSQKDELSKSVGDLDSKILMIEIEEIKKSIAALIDSKTRLTTLQDSEVAISKKIEMLENQLNISTHTFNDLSISKGKEEGAIAQFQEQLSDDYINLSHQELSDKISQLEKSLKQSGHKIEEYEENLNRANQDLSSIESTVNERSENLKKLTIKLENYETELSNAIESSIFSTINELRESELQEYEIKKIDSEIESYKAKTERIKTLKKSLMTRLTEIGQQENEDIKQLKLNYSNSKHDYESIQENKYKLESNLEHLKNAISEKDEILKESGSIIEEMKLLGRLERVIKGQDNPKISLKRFFLSQRLEEVLFQATIRMKVLSSGRFILKREKPKSTGAAQTGLDLSIFDNLTGTERPVNTLSGGQLFLASLSLALGLADVVQSRSGGLRMESLFIDEGFGTLDEEILQQALKVLNDLREGKMVGVISHVNELKREIPDRIEVKQQKIGSGISIVKS